MSSSAPSSTAEFETLDPAIAQAFACSYPWVVPRGPTRATHASHPARPSVPRAKPRRFAQEAVRRTRRTLSAAGHNCAGAACSWPGVHPAARAVRAHDLPRLRPHGLRRARHASHPRGSTRATHASHPCAWETTHSPFHGSGSRGARWTTRVRHHHPGARPDGAPPRARRCNRRLSPGLDR